MSLRNPWILNASVYMLLSQQNRFWKAVGIKVVKEQKIERKSVLLTNYLMEKEL